MLYLSCIKRDGEVRGTARQLSPRQQLDVMAVVVQEVESSPAPAGVDPHVVSLARPAAIGNTLGF